MKNSIFILALITMICWIVPNTLLAQCQDTFAVHLPNAIKDTLVFAPFVPPPPLPYSYAGNDNRLVFWVHGLGGDAGAWERVATVTEYQSTTNVISDYSHRMIKSRRPDYSSTSTSNIDAAASKVYSDMENETVATGLNPERSIIVAHSQGGIVSREVDRRAAIAPSFPPLAGGIVTFGTPHLGAKVLDNEAQIFTVLSQGCSDLTAGPLAERLDLSNQFLDEIIDEEKYIDILDNVLCDGVFKLAVDNFSGQFLESTTEDLCTTCDFIVDLNQDMRYHSVPRVAFYGVEEDPSLLRVLHFQSIEAVNGPEPFDANDDTGLISLFDTLYTNYQMKVVEWNNRYLFHVNRGHFLGAQWVVNYKAAKEAKEKRDQWQRGVNWMYSANGKWEAIIGGTEFSTVTTEFCECDYMLNSGEEGNHTVPITQANACQNYMPFNPSQYQYYYCNLYTNQQTTQTKVPTDGVVTKPSAEAFPGAQYIMDMPGSNHFQMRNDENTKKRLNELWLGNYGKFFETLER